MAIVLDTKANMRLLQFSEVLSGSLPPPSAPLRALNPAFQISVIDTWEDTIIDAMPHISIRCCPVRYGNDYVRTKRTTQELGRGRFSTLHPPTPPCLENLSQDGGSTGSEPLDPSFICRARLLILVVSSQTNGLPLSR